MGTSTVITARPYQLEAIEAVKDASERHISRQLISLPTGTGKTIFFSSLAKEFNVPTLIIAHREELIHQAVDKLEIVWPEADIGVVMADCDEVDKQIVVASVQTACREKRLQSLKAQDFKLLIIDEAHHATSESYQTIIRELGFFDGNKDKLLVGVTATPARGDKQSLGNVFQEVVFERSLSTMIRAGYLSDVKGKRILTQTDLSSVSVRGGDFVDYELSEIINTPQRNELVVTGFKEHASTRKAVAFCVDVAHSIALAETFNESGVKSAAVYGDMDKTLRREILDQFNSGEIQVLTNCQLLTEGYDQPSISCIIMARPTKSVSLYTQCIGRGTRLYPGKSDCLVIDFTDNCHDINSIANLDRIIPVASVERLEPREGEELVEKEKSARSVFVGQEYVGDFELFERSRFAWIPVKEHFVLKLSEDVTVWLKKQSSGYFVSIEFPDRMQNLSKKELPLGYAQGVAEDWIRRSGRHSTLAQKDAEWCKEKATEKQIATMERLGINRDLNSLSRGDAFLLINQKMQERQLWKNEESTQKQIYFLKSKGVEFQQPLTKGQAAKLIAQVKAREQYV